MKVLIVTAVFPPEPVVSSLLSFDIANELGNEGNNVNVICPRPTRPCGFKFTNFEESSGLFTKEVLNSYTSPKSKIIGRFRESKSFGLNCSHYIESNGICYEPGATCRFWCDDRHHFKTGFEHPQNLFDIHIRILPGTNYTLGGVKPGWFFSCWQTNHSDA